MNLTPIILSLGALLIGSLVTWIVMRSCKREKTLLQPMADEESSKFQAELKSLKNKLEDSQILVTEYEKKTSQITEKLNARESELENLQKEIESLANLSTEERADILFSNLKKEIEKKTKEINDKEEEIEELENELSSIKKKLAKEKSEVEKTSELLETTKKKLKETEQELESVSLDRNELQTENAIQSEAISFANAVLTAKPADDKDAVLIDKKLSLIESVINEEYIPLLDNEEYYKKWEEKKKWKQTVRKNISYWANLQRKSWLKGKKVIAFIGEFSAGKTSIVNRILTQDNANCPTLPVSSKATTAIATYISYGEGFLSQFTDANGDLKNLPEEMFLKVNKDILSKINASSLMRHFVMKYKNEHLKGLSILDTPGFSSNDTEDQGRTLDVINEADALFWVMDANTGDINKTSLKVISENIHDIPLYIIINKADTKSPGELEKLETHIRQTMQKANIKVKGYIRFSQKEKVDELMKIVKTLKSRRDNNDTKKIFIDIHSDIINLNKHTNDLRKEVRERAQSLEEFKDDIRSALDSLKEYSDRMTELPQLNKRWFRSNDYRMDEEEYQNFQSYGEFIGEMSENIYSALPSLLEEQEIYIQLIDSLNEFKNLHDKLKTILFQIMNAIKSFDAELHKEIMYACKNIQNEKTESRFNNFEEDADVTDDSETISDFSNKTKGFEAFQKAQSFDKQSKREEAKFWYIRSAKLGYKDAIVFCNKANYKF